MAVVAEGNVRSRALESLRAIRPRMTVIADEEGLKPFETDAFIAHRETPMLAVLPESEDQVRAVVKACRRLGVPVAEAAAGPGFSGRRDPHRDGVLLVLEDETGPRRGFARAAGDRRLGVQPATEAVAAHGLLAPDPSSQSICSIGGNVAENAGGVHWPQVRLTIHNLFAVRAIDADRRCDRHRRWRADAPGYDLLALLTGSEGNPA
jgi:glycolate oxidase